MTVDATAAEGGAVTEGEGVKTPTIEDIAKEQGWNSEYDGPDKIDAAEFVRRKPLFDKIKAQNRELKEVKKLVEGMATTYKSMSEVQFKKGIAAAEAKMKAAEAEFDVTAFKAAAAEKAELETAQQTTTTTTEPPEVTEFCERNPWFEKNPAMRTDALEYRENFLKRNPGASVKDTLDYIETKIKREYPEAFEAERKKPVAPAVEGAVSSSHTDPIAKLKASMSAEEKRIMKMFVKDGGLTESEYLKDYASVRER